MNPRILFVTFFALIASVLAAGTPESSKVKANMMIDGYFFNDFPSGKPDNIQSMLLRLDNGSMIMCYGYPKGHPLSEDDKALAIPVGNVDNGEEFLKQYRHRVASIPGGRLVPGTDIDLQTIKSGDSFPAFTAMDIDGNTWTNADIEGKVMVLNVWYTGCGPCRKEMPELSQWKDEMPEVMFFSSTYEPAELASPVLKERGFNWIPFVNNTQFRDLMGRDGYYPLTVVVDRTGTVSAVETGTSAEKRERLLTAIRELNNR